MAPAVTEVRGLTQGEVEGTPGGFQPTLLVKHSAASAGVQAVPRHQNQTGSEVTLMHNRHKPRL